MKFPLLTILVLTLFATSPLLAQSPQAPLPPVIPPVVSPPVTRDADANGIGDLLDARYRAARLNIATGGNRQAALKAFNGYAAQENETLRVLLTRPVTNSDLRRFEQLGGTVDYVYEHMFYGWEGNLPLRQLNEAAQRYGERLSAILLHESTDDLTLTVYPTARQAGNKPVMPYHPESFRNLDHVPETTDFDQVAAIAVMGEGSIASDIAATLRRHGVFAAALFDERDRHRFDAALQLMEEAAAREIHLDPSRIDALLAAAEDSISGKPYVPAALQLLDAPTTLPVAEDLSAEVPVWATVYPGIRQDTLSMRPPASADFDLYLYRDDKLTTVSRTRAAGAEEVLGVKGDGERWLVVKRIAGEGRFLLQHQTAGEVVSKTTTVINARQTERNAPIDLKANPLHPLLSAIKIDGIGNDLGNVAITNATEPVWPNLYLLNGRVAHDNDFLYLHFAAAAPRNEPSAFWLMLDSISGAGENHLRAGVPALPTAVLEPFMRADFLLCIENHTTGQPMRFAVRLVDYINNNSIKWGEIISGPPTRFLATEEMPVGFQAAFYRGGIYTREPQPPRSDEGLELRIPLGALGLNAPLLPNSPPRLIRMMIGAGRGDTGEWSNQTLAPVGVQSSLGHEPDFTRNIATIEGKEVPFEGVQTMNYEVNYLPFPTTQGSMK